MTNWQIILEPTTGTGFSKEFSPIINNTTTVVCAGANDEVLTGSETATIQIKNPFSGNFIDCPELTFVSGGNPLKTVFLDAGTYRISKSATTSAIGVSIQQNINTSIIKLGGV